jgi:hypothetical protein
LAIAITEKLIVRSNTIPTLPAGVEELKEIKRIELELSLYWHVFPNQSELQKIDTLQNLDKYSITLYCNSRTHFPAGIAALANLQVLKFGILALLEVSLPKSEA